MITDLLANPSFIQCDISENNATFGSGVLVQSRASPTFTDCQINYNLAPQKYPYSIGGGIRIIGTSEAPETDATFTRCDIIGCLPSALSIYVPSLRITPC